MVTNFTKNIFFKFIWYTFFCLLLVSCNKKDKPEIVKMSINHYLLPSINGQSNHKFIFLYQEEDNIGSNTWNELQDTIVNFNYQWGNIYEIYVRKAKIVNSSKKVYVLKEEIKKTPVSINTEFIIPIAEKKANTYYTHVIKKDSPYFYLKNSVPIHCGNKYNELNDMLQKQMNLKGKFIHTNNEIKLVEIITVQ